MYKLKILIFFIFILILFSLPSKSNDLVIAEVNGVEITFDSYKRVYDSRKKDFESNLNFDLYDTTNITNQKVKSRRHAILKKALSSGIKIDSYNVEKDFTTFIRSEGGVQSVTAKAEENNTNISQIKRKHKENTLLNLYFEKTEKKKIIDLLITEEIIMQESKINGIKVSSNELTKALKKEKAKYGGQEGFIEFLSENNASIQDVANELKKKLTHEKFLSYINKKIKVNEDEIKKAYKTLGTKEIKYNAIRPKLQSSIKKKKTNLIFQALIQKRKSASKVIVYSTHMNNSIAKAPNENIVNIDSPENKNPFEDQFLKSYFNR